MITHFTPRDRGNVEEIKIALQQLEKDYKLDMSSEKEWLDGLNERFNQPFLPSNIDEAAENYANNADYDYAECNPYKYTMDAFKAGAGWMAGQGVTKEGEIIIPFIPDKRIVIVEVQGNYKRGDKVIVQIRRK